MIQQSCINWGQVMCEYFNVCEYDWKENSVIYLVEEAKTDQEHTMFEFVGVRYYLCEKCYLGFLEIDKNFFKYNERLIYNKNLNLDTIPAFQMTLQRYIDLRKCKKVVEDNLKIFRFNRLELEEQYMMLKSINEKDYQRLFEEFNDSQGNIKNSKAIELSLNERINLIRVILDNMPK